MTVEQLSTLDTAFLELEQSQDSSHMHIGGTLIFDPLPGGGTPSHEDIVQRIRDRIGHLPRFSQRLSSTHTSATRWLTWEPMPNYDPATHVRHATLPAPGGRAELEEWLGDFWSHRLDRHQPLWEMVLLDGLEDGRWAIATKTHHCLVDGVGAVDITFLVLDAFGDAPITDADAPQVEQDGNGGGRHFLHPEVLLRNARTSLEAAARPRESLEKARAAIDLIINRDLNSAPPTSFNTELSAARHYRTARVSIADIKRVRQQHGGTLNDVVLALCASGLRDLLLARGEEPPAGVRAQVPVNIRSKEQEHTLGNRASNLLVELPVDEPDPLTRLSLAIERTEECKAGPQQTGSKAWLDLSDLGPPLIGALVARSIFSSPRMFNLTITNVPGPQMELTAFGAPMVDALPFVPLIAEHTLGIAIFSYNGALTFGICADRLTVPDVDMLAGSIERSFAELLAHA